ncbi:MAG: hypothetical protein JRE64_09510 [Deltaproteobacteria bacterium]|nr:hypothetical protein [Deltaproteobacteria bacterium]
MARRRICSYCGERIATDKEHVFPRNLYPESKATSRVQRLTIPSCNICNNGWSDDEVHFRNMLALAGQPNESRRELWETTIHRSLRQPDGARRIKDLVDSMRSVEIDGRPRHMVFPGQDPRVVRVVSKVVRGLCHHHEIMSAVPESRVWVDIMEYMVPEQFLSDLTYAHLEKDIAEYRYSVIEDLGIQSAWLITFFERITFIGIVSSTENGLMEGG